MLFCQTLARKNFETKKGLAIFSQVPDFICGAEGETRTPTAIQPLDPEPSASTSSATSARGKRLISSISSYIYMRLKTLSSVNLRPKSTIKIVETLVINSFMRFVFILRCRQNYCIPLLAKDFIKLGGGFGLDRPKA